MKFLEIKIDEFFYYLVEKFKNKLLNLVFNLTRFMRYFFIAI
jgi:hypothetical protein